MISRRQYIARALSNTILLALALGSMGALVVATWLWEVVP